ncbi:myelin-oligodendrocyte glycoprotein-like isoform X2 [Scomber scombrus]|uniref:Myelin-oligodendrocyte glycoprotein-like isoform X2 n=1 Tax=Scomber scombrus TaxID=13677 RepID=A0AAV1QFW7_SCOSC
MDFSNMLVTITLCLAFISWTPVEGQSDVIGSSQPIIASPGDDVILPCHLNPEFDVQELTVEWSKPDLKPDPLAYVHVYRHRREDYNMKIPAYIGRTEMFVDQLEHGNISLKILNVMLADEGRYRCFVPKLNSGVQYAIVRLVVEPNSDKTVTTEMPLHSRNLQTPDPMDETDVKGVRANWIAVISSVVVSCILLIAIVCAYLLKQRCQNPNHPKYDEVHASSTPLPA